MVHFVESSLRFVKMDRIFFIEDTLAIEWKATVKKDKNERKKKKKKKKKKKRKEKKEERERIYGIQNTEILFNKAIAPFEGV